VKRSARVPSQLSESLHKRLGAYALVASAAGVGLLALTPAAEARIVYTPAHHVIDLVHHRYKLDLNHDGAPDFWFNLGSGCCQLVWLEVFGYRGAGSIAGKHSSAFALRPGVRVSRATQSAAGLVGEQYLSGSSGPLYGLWVGDGNGVQDRYLGLKFLINGKYHYGWARLNVYCGKKYSHGINATLTGYAYETIPNKPIITGKTHGENEATLGRLAQGASGASNGGEP